MGVDPEACYTQSSVVAIDSGCNLGFDTRGVASGSVRESWRELSNLELEPEHVLEFQVAVANSLEAECCCVRERGLMQLVMLQ